MKPIEEFFESDNFINHHKKFNGIITDDYIKSIVDYLNTQKGRSSSIDINSKQEVKSNQIGVKPHIIDLYPDDNYYSFTYREIYDKADWNAFVKIFKYKPDLEDLLFYHDGWDDSVRIPETLVKQWDLYK